MYNNISVQNIATIKASAFADLDSTPVTIALRSEFDDGCTEITMHVANVKLALALVEAINRAVKSVAVQS